MAGVATVWVADLVAPPPTRPRLQLSRFALFGGWLTVACAALAMLPDFDLVFGLHRTISHSLGATLSVAFACLLAARALRLPLLRTTVVCAAAYATHILLDWIADDPSYPQGLMVFWPLSHTYSQLGLEVFKGISRRYWRPQEFVMGNAVAAARELLVLGGPLVLLWLVRVKTFAALPSKLSGGHHPPQ